MKAWRVLVCTSLAVVGLGGATTSCGSDALTAVGSDGGSDGGSDARATADGSIEGGGGTPLDQATQAALARDLAAARCDQAVTCGGRALVTEGPHNHYPFRFGFDAVKMSADICKGETTARLRNTFVANLATAVVTGQIVVHSEKIAGCLAAIRATCDSDSFLLPACREAFEGTTPLRGSCATDAACAGGALCEFGNQDHCDGVCVAPKKAAETCYAGSACDEGLFCPPSGGVCLLRPKKGESCKQITSGYLPPCTGFQYCVEGAPTATCKPLAEIATKMLGTSCDDRTGVWCVPPMYCASQTTDPDAGPSNGGSCRGQYSAGAMCAFSYPDLCPDTHYCEGTSGTGGTCNPRRAAGATCTEQQSCADGTTCVGGNSGLTGVCLPVKDNGETCTTASTCWSGQCTKGKCTATHCG